MGTRDAELTAHVCLALVAEGPTHGWALVRLLSPAAEVGRIWSVSRPLVYRALDGLAEERSITRAATVPGQGRERAMVRVTPRGRVIVDEWLGRPVEHLRDVRTELLTKLALRERRGLQSVDLLVAQRDAFAPAIATLARRRATDDPVEMWRRESARAVGRFLDTALRRARRAASSGAAEPDLRSVSQRR